MKKLASLMMVLVMVFSLAANVFASNGVVDQADIIDVTNTRVDLIINNAQAGAEVFMYKILDVVHFDPDYDVSPNVDGIQPNIRYKVHTTDYITKDAMGNDITTVIRHNWAGFIEDKTKAVENQYVNVDSEGYVTWNPNKNTTTDAVAFANAAYDHALGYVAGEPTANWNRIIDACAASKTVMPDDSEGRTVGTVTFKGLEMGYYLVTSTMGRNALLVNVVPQIAQDGTVTNVVEINGKNKPIVVDKLVQEDSTMEWGKTNDADVGQVVNFVTYITTEKGVEGYDNLGAMYYVYADLMEKGLLLDKTSIEVAYSTGIVTDSVGPEDLTYEKLNRKTNDVPDGVYTVIYPAELSSEEAKNHCREEEPCTFHVVFEQSFLDTLVSDRVLKISYSATITEDAVIRDENGKPVLDPLTNKGRLRYGKDSNHFTDWSWTDTYVWELDVLKYDATSTSLVLEGAEFILYKNVNNGDTTEVYYAKFDKIMDVVRDNNGKPVLDAQGNFTESTTEVAGYRFAGWTTVEKEATALVTNSEGNIAILGLDADEASTTYFLKETKAPPSYNLLTEAIAVYVTSQVHTVGSENGTFTGDCAGKPNPHRDYTVEVDGEADAKVEMQDKTVKVANKKGVELPETGGMGTTMFYILGGMMTLGAAVLLITKRRMAA